MRWATSDVPPSVRIGFDGISNVDEQSTYQSLGQVIPRTDAGSFEILSASEKS